ncbi:thiamine pyrophosphate-binding protein [Yoonia litorea]|uniref:Acetolactate synthase-1/2/3 large subunit n=1 Tax=Yoonia litorea TaxID=1123755 RepID=A0A1I6N0A6_9RHOB|nr:thiamine pyrophosphate-binding protein [Yoonia litorea]SFS21379.1 acetolactate synthase-1/2/3 large subunit [Yoonia litorea]
MVRHGGKILSDQLVKLGVKRVFSVPGESFLAALDGLYDSGIANIVCRQEGGAAMMAEAYGKMTGTPGVCFVTRGPGATNAAAGIHIAMQDSTPMVLFVGQIDNRHTDRETFQEVDYKAVFGSLAKWVAQVDHTDRLPEYIGRAFRVAMSGRPGPVVLALPENMLSADAEVADITLPTLPKAQMTPDTLQSVMHALGQAERPLVVIGGPHWSPEAQADLQAFAEIQSVPIAVSFRRQDYINNHHRCYAGDLNVGINPRLAKRVREADLLLLIGTRFGDIETQGYTLVDPADPQKTIIHIHADADEIGRVYTPAIGITATAPAALDQLSNAAPAGDWSGWTAAARADYEAWLAPQESPGALKQEAVIKWLSDNLPDDAVVTNGAGNYAAWLHRYFVYKRHGTQLAPTSGSMGYGFPAAISASLEHPDRTVVCLAGDGCFQMTCNEMSTAVQHGAKPIVVVMNNGRYGTIRMHQEKHYPARVSGTMLANPDFAAFARAYGGHGELVDRSEDFGASFARAVASGLPAVIECRVDEEALSTGATLSAVRDAALGK